jgi:hypothetical protein
VLAAKRLRHRLAAFAALAGVALVVSALGVGLDGYLADSETAGVRTNLATRAGTDLSLEASVALADNADEQDTQMRALLARELPPSLTVVRTVTSKLPVGTSDETPLILYSIDDLAEVATIVSGAWPDAPDQVSVQVDAASALGLTVGSALQLAGQSVTVAATWQADDPLAGRWMGDRLIAEGSDGADVGPIVIDESLWADLPASPRARWALTADRTQIGPHDLSRIVTGWNALDEVIRAEDLIYDVSFERHGRLAAVASEILAQVESLRAVVPVALLTIGAIGLLTVIELARLLTTLRSPESSLLWARGATAPGLAAAAAGETALVVIPAAALGSLLGSAAALLGPGDHGAAPATGWTWAAPLAVAAVITAIVTATTWTVGRALESRDTVVRAPRSRRFVGLGAIALVVSAAALSTWQLLLYGSPVTVSANGQPRVDPVAVTAPALLLVSVVLVITAIVTALAPGIARRAEATRGVRRALVSRLMARQLRLTVIPFVLCALVSGQFAIAASYSSTWDSSFTESRELRTGSTLSLSGGRLTEAVIDQAAAVPDVDAVAPIIVQNTPFGIEQASLVAAAPDAVRSLAADGGGLVNLALLADAIQAPPAGEPVTETLLSIDTVVTGLGPPPSIRALLSDELGALHTVALKREGAATTYAAPVEPGWVLIALDLDVPDGAFQESAPTITLTGGTIDLTIPWNAFTLRAFNYELQRTGSGVGFELPPGGPVRIVAGIPDGSVVPVAISQLLADTADVHLGDTLPVIVSSQQNSFTATVTAIVPAIPGAQREYAAMIDIATLRRVVLGIFDSPPLATQAWVASAQPNVAADALRAALPARVGVASLEHDQARSILGSASSALWIGAIGAAALALLALVTVVQAQLSSRRPEVMVLTALGLGSTTTASMRRIEFGIAAGGGIVAGLIAGAVVTVLTVPTLARAAVPDVFIGVPTVPTVAAIPVAIGLGAFALGLVAVSFVYGFLVAAQSRQQSLRDQAT